MMVLCGSGTSDSQTSAASSVRVAVLALLWGSTFLWIEIALRVFTPVQITVARCFLGAATLVAVCLVRGVSLPRERGIWRHVLFAALLCNATPFLLFSLGQQTVGSGLAGVLNATTPLWSAVLGLILGTERSPGRLRITGLLTGFAGTVVIFAPWRQDGASSLGVLAILAAAASYAVAFAYMHRHLVGRGYPTLSLSAAQLTAATAISAVALPAGGTIPGHIPWNTAVVVLVLGVFTTGVTFHLTYRIIADESATNAATVGYLLPVVSVALGVLFLGEALDLRAVVGGVVVVAGVALTRVTGTSAVAVSSPEAAPDRTC